MSISEVKSRILPLLRAYRVGRASVFGSVVRGEDKPDSDLELLVEMPAGASLLDLAGLKLDLEKLLGREVDVVTYRSLNPLLRDRILAEQQAIETKSARDAAAQALNEQASFTQYAPAVLDQAANGFTAAMTSYRLP